MSSVNLQSSMCMHATAEQGTTNTKVKVASRCRIGELIVNYRFNDIHAKTEPTLKYAKIFCAFLPFNLMQINLC